MKTVSFEPPSSHRRPSFTGGSIGSIGSIVLGLDERSSRLPTREYFARFPWAPAELDPGRVSAGEFLRAFADADV